MFRVLTLASEFGSGASSIARRVAEELHWNLLDDGLIREVARAAQVDPETVRKYDEHVEPWWRRFLTAGLRAACIHAGATLADAQRVDLATTMAIITQQVITRAAATGNCVIVGRGAECVLQDRMDVLHVFIYGPWAERVSRVSRRGHPLQDLERRIRRIDRERASYLRSHYGCDWKDSHLYHLMLSSQIGDEEAARTIVDIIRNSGVIARIRISMSLPAS